MAIYRDVGSALDGRTLVALSLKDTVREAATILSKQEVGAAPVLSEGRLVGVFSERDILRRVVARNRDPNATLVADVMTPEPSTTTPRSSLANAFGMMIEGAFRHLPVVGDDGRVIAMLSMSDIPPEYRILHQRWVEWTNGQGAGMPPCKDAPQAPQSATA